MSIYALTLRPGPVEAQGGLTNYNRDPYFAKSLKRATK